MDNEKKERVAEEMLGMAKALLAEDQPEKTTTAKTGATKVAADASPELMKAAKGLGSLAQEFKDTHVGLIRALNDAEKKVKENKALLSSYYKDWPSRSMYLKARKAVLEQANQCLETGDILEDLGDDMEIVIKTSMQPSYVQQLKILLSMLNERETKKYQDLLGNYFKKQIATLNAGVGNLNGDVKEWHQEAQDIASERGVKLPKASAAMPGALARGRVRHAGMLDGLMEAIQSIIPSLVRKVTEWGKRFYNSIMRNGDELDELTSDVLNMASRASSTVN